MKVLLDTNVLISGIFFGGPPRAVLDAWAEERFELLVSPLIFDEYVRTCDRLSALHPGLEYQAILASIIGYGKLVADSTSSHPTTSPTSRVGYLRGHGATCSCLRYFRISLKSAVFSVTSVAPDSLHDAARRKSLTKDLGILLSSRASCRAIAAIADPAWSQAEWLGVKTRPDRANGPSKSSRICRAFDVVLAPTISS